jgi:shikimate dehydrogenase
MPPGRTRLFVLLGDPVEHSWSPAFQNAAIAALRLDAVYVALQVTADELPVVMRAHARAGGGNVTVPHKARAAAALDEPAPAVRATGACNTFFWDDARGLVGDNTDVEGFRLAAESLLPAGLRGRRVLLVGAGGAARAAAVAALAAEVAALHILNRTPARAHALLTDLGSPAAARVAAAPGELAGESYDLVVNATPLGFKATDRPPLDLRKEPRVAAVLDLVYGRDDTPWVREARRLGLAAADGREMLVRQGAAAFRLWWGVEPPLDVMRAAVGLR